MKILIFLKIIVDLIKLIGFGSWIELKIEGNISFLHSIKIHREKWIDNYFSYTSI